MLPSSSRSRRRTVCFVRERVAELERLNLELKARVIELEGINAELEPQNAALKQKLP